MADAVQVYSFEMREETDISFIREILSCLILVIGKVKMYAPN